MEKKQATLGRAQQFQNLNPIRDALGWVDDFRVSPGQCGQPLTRLIYIDALLSGGASIRDLKEMGFCREEVEKVLFQKLDKEYA